MSISSAQQASTTAVPNLIRYSGTLKDADGAPVGAPTAATLGVTFAIYKQQDGGAPVWMETQNVKPDASGQYSVLLGSTTATGLPSDLFSQEEQRWLGVQAQGQAEQPRVLLVSVPYAFKAHEAETLGGLPASAFVQAAPTDASTDGSDASQAAASTANQSQSTQPEIDADAASQGPTTFSGSTTHQIVRVIQSGTGAGVNASASSNAVFGRATGSGRVFGVQGVAPGTDGIAVFGNANSPTGGIGVFGAANSTTGVAFGVKGSSTSTSGTGMRALASAASGTTTGISAQVNSPDGTAGVFNNAVGGNILSGRDNNVEKFSVDGGGNVASAGRFTGNGSGLTGMQFSQLGGLLDSSQLSGSYSNAVTLSNTANVFYGDGSHLTGTGGGGGGNYILNGTSQQLNANFNIDGTGTANAFNSATNYQIGGSTVLSIGMPSDSNLFLGVGAGQANVAGAGIGNTFTGFQAGYKNSTGGGNTFFGAYAGYDNTSGEGNTFFGVDAGIYNVTGNGNTFVGASAGYSSTGDDNTFVGESAGDNATGEGNTFVGTRAGDSNLQGSTGDDNTLVGVDAGRNNTSGYGNVFFGTGAGYMNTSGYYNIFVGENAGYNSNEGSGDIYIGNQGPASSDESHTTRIGTQGTGGREQNVTYIAGIYGSISASGVPVYINSDGKLGTQTSSMRFKEQVRDMGDSTNALMKLRPVTFLYKPEYDKGERTLQYGLIAEEVAKVYPDMVAYDKDGQPYTVKYQYLAPMLLNELQKQHAVVAAQQDVIKTQQEQIENLQQQNEEFQQRLVRLESLVARR